MIHITELSQIGLGTYRMQNDSVEHKNAFSKAIDNGCTLIDTSSNYTNGASEKMIGSILVKNPDLSNQLFIITKAGYLLSDTFEILVSENSIKEISGEYAIVSEYHKQCIHPFFLEDQLKQSLKRLNRSYIDCFMLHNPEYYFQDKNSVPNTEIYYSRIEKAFLFLEEQVSKGIIRYYGISSNSFPLSISKDSTTNLQIVLDIANKISNKHHFKFIQFPFNFFEQGAIDKQYPNNKSLLDLAKENGIITIANRPLSSEDKNGFARFATYPDINISLEEEKKDRMIVHDLIQRLDIQVKANDPNCESIDFPVVKLLNSHYNNAGNIEAVDMLYGKLYQDFIEPLFEYKVPNDIIESLQYLKAQSKKYSLLKMTKRSTTIKKQLITKGEIASFDSRPFSVISCDAYLKKGIDHVLVGMRKESYVKQFQTLLSTTKESILK